MRFAYFTLAFLVVLTVSVMGFRGKVSTRPPVEVFPDMDHQAKYKPQAESKFFADGRADRPAPSGTVPRGRTEDADPDYLRADDAKYRGRNADGSFVRGFPVEINESYIRRGQDRYMIYCAPCHGALGDGNGITKSYGMAVTPTYHDARLRDMPEGELYNTVANGKNTMLGYADKLSVSDRWAVVAYVRALQRAHHGKLDDVPMDKRGELK
jgi:mono/diheme cytochrome c family protein